jgi:hypothetical protein
MALVITTAVGLLTFFLTPIILGTAFIRSALTAELSRSVPLRA